MDKSASGKEAREEITRESLIALSYSVPDPDNKALPSEHHNGQKLGEGVDYDGAEKFRSELISISYSQSPVTEGQPVTTAKGTGN